MVPIARRNLFHDKGRMILTVIGLAIIVILVLYNMGVLIYAMSTAGIYIEHVNADIWVTRPGSTSLPKRSSIRKTMAGLVRSIEGVTDVSPLLLTDMEAMTVTGLPEAEEKKFPITLVGYDTTSGRGGPWQYREGALSTVPADREIILDGRVADKHGISVGDTIRVGNINLKVIALSEETSTLSEQMGFVPLKTAHRITGADEISYLLVKTERPALVGSDSPSHRGPVWDCPICEQIQERTGLEALSGEQFRHNSIAVWMEWMGIWMVAMCIVILMVGVVVLMLTVYTATIERLPEFGVLKAIGATNWHIAKIVLKQALISVTMGYGAGYVLTLLLVAMMAKVDPYTTVNLSPVLTITTYMVMVLLSILASLLAVRKAIKVDPLIVFQTRY